MGGTSDGRPSLTGRDPLALYRAAQRADGRKSGYYNDNVRLDTATGPVLVRIPVPRADRMDLRIWDEADVLRAVSPRVIRVPRLLYASSDPSFQIHEFVSGPQLDELAPRGVPLPADVISDVLQVLAELATVPLAELPPLPDAWPADENCSDFASRLSADTQRVFEESQAEFGDLFRAFGIPDDPLATIVPYWSKLTRRPFRLLHADIHRRNILMSSRGAIFLDWELALWGDPVYELAVNVHKMSYLDDELRALFSGWEAMAGPALLRSWHEDLTAYLRHERVKSAIVDSVRYSKEILAADTTHARYGILTEKLSEKLNSAADVLGRRASLTAQDVRGIISDWQQGRAGSRT